MSETITGGPEAITVQAFCADGDIAIGAGFSGVRNGTVSASQMVVSGWSFQFWNSSATSDQVTVTATCLDVTPELAPPELGAE